VCLGRLHGIYVVSADGSGLRHFLDDLPTQMSWSPDGRRLAFAGLLTGEPGIYIADIATGRKHRLFRFNISGVSWSPGGRKIVFDWWREVGQMPDRIAKAGRIWEIGIDGHGLRRLTTEHGYAPQVSPDGRRISFISGNHRWIRVMNSDGSHAHTVAHALLTLIRPAVWSPDSRWLATASMWSGIFVFPADGSQAPRKIAPGRNIVGVTWAP
jgi:TolB protein